MKKKIAIFGAGMSGLAAAHTITSQSGWSESFDVTIYQLGWRVGGKTTTGRGKYERIEEHGIHILQGWYENTFALIQDVYKERAHFNLDPNSPFQKWDDGFVNDSATLLTEWIPGRGWVNWPMVFTTNSAVPGDGVPLSLMQIAKKGLAVCLETLLGSPYQTGQSEIVKWILDQFFPPGSNWQGPQTGLQKPPWWNNAIAQARAMNLDPRLPDELRLAYYAHSLIPDIDRPAPTGPNPLGPGAGTIVFFILLDLVEWLIALVKDVLGAPDAVRRMITLVDLGGALIRGIFADVWDPQTQTFDFRKINNQDFRAWIAKNGAHEIATRSVIVRFLYTGTFANLTDGNDQGGELAAGSALRFLLESAGYKGSFVWKFKAGTGDTMVMPLYQVLVHRGVKFELFTDVEKIHYSTTGAIERIDVGQQARPATGPDGRPVKYVPTVVVDNVTAWPAEPNWQYIDPADAAILQAKHIDLEEPWIDWTSPVKRALQNGTDFDIAILAIPVGTLKWICADLAANVPAWQDMVTHVATTQTQAMQLWFSVNLETLGMKLDDWGMAADCAPNTVVYENPMYSWIDMSLVLPYEKWPTGHLPQLCLYYTGPLSDALEIPPPGPAAHWFPAQQRARVMDISKQWLQDNMGWFWPNATAPEAPAGLDLAFLTDGTDEKSSGAVKFSRQYFRANVAPWQRFTLAIPGTEQFRMKTDASGFSNLFLTGDWIDYGMNVGYIEGAITSGVLAGNAVLASLQQGKQKQLTLPVDLAR